MRVERKNEQKTQTEIGKRNKSKYIVSDLNLLLQFLLYFIMHLSALTYISRIVKKVDYVLIVPYLFFSIE